MNLALQKRHEQLERWRQNEANVELIEKQQAAAAAAAAATARSGDINNNRTSQTTNRSIQDLNISTTTTPFNPTQQQQQTSTNNSNLIVNLSNTNDDNFFINNPTSTNNYNKRVSNKRKGNKSSNDLQVKFTNSTLFLTACANGDMNECQRLLSEKLIDINVTTCDGLTGLHEAAICGNTQMVEYLINQGANINCCDNEGWTPLHAASSLGQVDIVELLLKYNADVTIVNCENFLAYDLARNDQVKELIEQRLQGLDLDYLHSQEELLIEKDINTWIKTGKYEERSHPVTNATVLHVLAAKGYLNLMKKLLQEPKLKKQINLEAKDNEGFTPLLAASFWNQNEIVELLIEHGANIFAQANNGYKISSIVSIFSLNHLLMAPYCHLECIDPHYTDDRDLRERSLIYRSLSLFFERISR